ncbi:TadA family conjugal transfer-associated ATPase [Humidisolicoccus flavus]|uniref:TadA family conjugal transfer-associated ATPase n=1 Tax=Humidisolicoccus flavus TaxID=3111414 RepID=UPI0032504A23
MTSEMRVRARGVPFVAGRAPRTVASVRLGDGGSGLEEFGELVPLVMDGAITDVFVRAGEVWVDQGAGAERVADLRLRERRVRELAVTLLECAGRHVDESHPFADAQLHDGIRVHAVLPPIALGGVELSIRLPRVERLTLDTLHETGALTDLQLEVLQSLIARRANILISGAGGSGKTTLLSAMLGQADVRERIITIEDVAELRIAHPHVVSLQSRQSNIEGVGSVGLAELVREALRMRPDRLVVGECRGVEVRELLAALNTGHDGGAGTMHANSLEDVPARLEALGALASMSTGALARQVVSAFDAVVHVVRGPEGRRIERIGRFTLRDGALEVNDAGSRPLA